MVNGRQSSIDTWHRRTLPSDWAVNHHNGDAKLARRLDLCIGRCAAGILGHNVRNPVFREQGKLILDGERPPCGDVTRAGKIERRLDRVDTANKIVMMRRGLEGQKLLTSERQKSPCAMTTQCHNGTLDIGHTYPPVSRMTLPCGSFKRDQRNIGLLRRLTCVGRDARRIGVRCVHQKIEPMLGDELSQTAGAAKASRAHRHGLLDRFTRASGHRQKNPASGFVGKLASQNTGIRCATENEYGACHDL